MEDKTHDSIKRKEDVTTDRDSPKITNFFPVLKTEGRAKMCAAKTDDSKQKEILKKMKGKESMSLRSKRFDKSSEKSSNKEGISQTKEKLRNISVASALKTPLSQVLRKSIEASDKREVLAKSKLSDNSSKIEPYIIKKENFDSEGGRTLRPKAPLPEKPKRMYRRRTDSTETSDKTKSSESIKTRTTQKISMQHLDTLLEEARSENSNSKSSIQKKTYRKRHFRGSTYGLYLTPAKKKKNVTKPKSSLEKNKDDESVTSTENNSFLDSEDANSIVSEDICMPSEKSLIEEDHGSENQKLLKQSNSDKKIEKSELNSQESEEASSTAQIVNASETEVKIDINADYEENTQNVTDLFQELEEMQWESDQKASDCVDNKNSSQVIKVSQFDDISSESASNALHFSFKDIAPKTTENDEIKDDEIIEKIEESSLLCTNDNKDSIVELDHKIDLPDTALSIHDSLSDVFNMKDDSNIVSSVGFENKEDLNFTTSNLDENKEDSKLSDIISNKEESNLAFPDVSGNKQESNPINSEFLDDKEIDLASSVTIKTEDISNVASPELLDEHKDSSNLMETDTVETKDDIESTSLNKSNLRESKHNTYSYVLTCDNMEDFTSSSSVNENNQESNIPVFTSISKQDSNSFASNSESNKVVSSFASINNDTNKDVTSFIPINNESSKDINSFASMNDNCNKETNSLTYINENAKDTNYISLTNEKRISSDNLIFSVEDKQDSLGFCNQNKQDSNSFILPTTNDQNSNSVESPIDNKQISVVPLDENKQDSGTLAFSNENKQDLSIFPFSNENKQDSIVIAFSSEDKQDSHTLGFSIDKKQDSNNPFPTENKQDSNSLLFLENKQDSDSLLFPNENNNDSVSLGFMDENQNDSNSLSFTNEKPDSNSLSFANATKLGSSFLSFSNENKNDSSSVSPANEKKLDSKTLAFNDTNDKNINPGESVFTNLNENTPITEALTFSCINENESHSGVITLSCENKHDSDPISLKDYDASQTIHENKKNELNFEPNMDIDNSEKQDDGDGESTIANCVKSRQRIKRKFTDDVVDTDLGILSVAAMASVKKVTKPDKDGNENFQSITTQSEAKRGVTMTKIECIFNYKQSPVKQCDCEGDSYQAPIGKNEEIAFCQAVESIDDKLLGCCNRVVTSRLVRPSVKIAFSIMCEMHLWRLKHHHACPYCGLFCSQGTFMQCRSEENGKDIHLYHEQCQSKDDEHNRFCLHCGSTDKLKRVHLELHMTSPPSFFLSQSSNSSVPDVSKARISFTENSDFCRKDDDEATQVFKIEDSGKVLSSAGLPNGTNKEELEKLICALGDEKVRSFNFQSDEFYDMAVSGNILKVLYMLAKGFDPNHKFPNHDNEAALHAASASGHITVVHLLIQAGAIHDSLNEKMYTPLMLAVENGHKDVVHYLVKKGALTDFKGETGMSSLHLAAKSGNLDVLKILMSSRDTDINAQDDGGWTPIVWASEHDHLNVVRYLLKRGANPNIRDNEGNIGLHWSAFSGSVEISYLYLDYGCDINSVNELGDTPLHIAARQDSFPCVTLFLSRGADVQILNKANKLPAECCIDKNSDTYLSLSLNMLVKRITSKYQHKAEKIIHRDISRGKEQLAIQCVNAVDDEMPPLDFLYVTENCETMPIKIDRTITSLQSCHCEDDCSTSNCSCASISYQCWYDKEGLLLPEFNLLDPPMLFECNRACSCWSLNCHNRVLQNGITARLQLIRTKGKGWGVQSLKDIPKGAFICEYVGELISDSAADKRSDDSYLFDLDNRDGETYCLDARYYGNISRFINHLCEPNLVPVKIYVDHQDLNFPRIAFFSSRDIKQYEELGFDYGEKFWAIKYKFFTCECGTPKCKYSKESIHITLANYYRRLKEEQMEEAAASQQQPVVTTAAE